MTSQEFFNASVAHLRRQGRRAFDPVSGQCVYRHQRAGGEILACAVGGVMPDDLAQSVIEEGLNGSPAYRLVGDHPGAGKFFAGVSLSLLSEMQNVHDRVGVGSWESAFRVVAHEFGLEYTAPDTSTPA